MRGFITRFLWLFLLLFVAGVAGLAYYYYNYSIDGEKLVRQALRNEQKIKSYYCNLELSTAPAGVKGRYFVQVWFNAPASYRVEVFTSYIGDGPPSQVFISDGEKQWIYNPELGEYYIINPLTESGPSSSPFLLTAFLQEMARAREISLLGKEDYEGKSYYLLKVIPQQRERFHAWEKVWLDRRSLLPVKIEVYGEEGSLNQTIVFKKIDLNPRLNRVLFRIDNAFFR